MASTALDDSDCFAQTSWKSRRGSFHAAVEIRSSRHDSFSSCTGEREQKVAFQLNPHCNQQEARLSGDSNFNIFTKTVTWGLINIRGPKMSIGNFSPGKGPFDQSYGRRAQAFLSSQKQIAHQPRRRLELINQDMRTSPIDGELLVKCARQWQGAELGYGRVFFRWCGCSIWYPCGCVFVSCFPFLFFSGTAKEHPPPQDP